MVADVGDNAFERRVVGVVVGVDHDVTECGPAVVDVAVRDAHHDKRQAGPGLRHIVAREGEPLVQVEHDGPASLGDHVAAQLGEQ